MVKSNTPAEKDAKVIDVKFVTLDEEMYEKRGSKEIDMLTTDTEGNDCRVQKGAHKLITNSPNIVVIMEWMAWTYTDQETRDCWANLGKMGLNYVYQFKDDANDWDIESDVNGLKTAFSLDSTQGFAKIVFPIDISALYPPYPTYNGADFDLVVTKEPLPGL